MAACPAETCMASAMDTSAIAIIELLTGLRAEPMNRGVTKRALNGFPWPASWFLGVVPPPSERGEVDVVDVRGVLAEHLAPEGVIDRLERRDRLAQRLGKQAGGVREVGLEH